MKATSTMERMKMLTRVKSWLKCSMMRKEVQLEKCKFRMRKKILVKMKKALRNNKFSEVDKTSKMRNRMMKNTKWVRKKMEIKISWIQKWLSS
jgi:hypothetical protein